MIRTCLDKTILRKAFPLHYAGEGEAVTWNICGEDVKGNFYTFFADTLRGEVVEALVVGANGSQPFEFGAILTALSYFGKSLSNHHKNQRDAERWQMNSPLHYT